MTIENHRRRWTIIKKDHSGSAPPTSPTGDKFGFLRELVRDCTGVTPVWAVVAGEDSSDSTAACF